MELRQFKYFDSLVKNSQFVKAAEELHITQPSLSAQIKQLEKELDIQLLDRSQKGIKLTDAGQIFYKHASIVIQQVEDCKKEINDLKKLEKGHIVIGALPTVIVSWLPQVISSFKQRFPNVNIEIRNLDAVNLKKNIAHYNVDMGIITYPLDNNIYDTIPFLHEELFLIVPPNHPLTFKSRVYLRDLKDEPFLMYQKETQSRYTIIEACKEAGFTPYIAYEIDRVEIIISFVSSGLGVAFVPKGSLDFNKHKVAILSVESPKPIRTLCIAFNKKRYVPHAAKAFQDHLLSYFDIDSNSLS